MKARWMMLFGILAALTLVGGQYEDRWFYVSRGLNTDQELADVEELVRTAGKVNLNGMLFSCGVEGYATWTPDKKVRLALLKQTCEVNGVEIIPIIWSIGYGTMLWQNPNYVEGLPARDIPYIAKGGKAFLKQEEVPPIQNGDFEQHDGDRFAIKGAIDAPGVRSFADTTVMHGGKCSVRLTNFTKDQHGHGRICLNVNLIPNRRYRMRLFARSEDFVPNKNVFLLQFYSKKGKQIAVAKPDIEPTQDWKEYSLLFSSSDVTEGNLYMGAWGGKEGKLWIDDVSLELDGVTDVIRRDGTPFTVKNAKTGEVYVEERDYGKVEGLKRGAKASNDSLVLELPAGSRIQNGDELLISFYQPARYGVSQRTTCMSEPALYDEFRRSAREIMEALNPRKWFLSMDEVRAGGTCVACEARHTDMAHILADCITKQRQIIKEVRPDAEIYIWSDMLDPNHNARDNYVNCKGTFEGVWNLVPKDLVISCWYHKKRELSMPFFEKLGFKTQAAAYYDSDSLTGCREWLETCNHTKNCTGIMYTSWQRKYALLEDFGKMVQEFSKPLE
ncbi:MAG: hypothetical protein IKP00_17725 [Victivallales bacterium]|nr:hypothetical protein [Victivallales bacterium]